MRRVCKSVNPPSAFISCQKCTGLAIALIMLVSSLGWPACIFAENDTHAVLTAGRVKSLFKWDCLAGKGIRLHYVAGNIDRITARKLLREREAILSGLSDFFLVMPPKTIDLFLAPAKKGLGGPHIFAKTWSALATWYGKGSEEELHPGRTIAKIYIHHLAGDARTPHPFVLAGMSRLCSKSGKGAIRAHHMLRGRAEADGLKLPLSISAKDLAAKDERAKQKAASVFFFLKEITKISNLAALPRATAAISWNQRSLSARWLKAVRALTGMQLNRFLKNWNRFLSKAKSNISSKSQYWRDAKDALAAEEEEITYCLPYRDSPRVQFVARSKTKQIYLIGYQRNSMVAEKRLRQKAPKFTPLRWRGDRLRRSFMTAKQKFALNRLLEDRVKAIGRDDEKGLIRKMSAKDWDHQQRTAMAKRLLRQLRSMKVKSVRPIFEVFTELDMGPAQGKVEINQRILFKGNKPIILDETWRPLSR